MKLDQAREERRLAQLDVKRAEEKREQFTLRSPIDGLVTQRYLNPGESVKDRPITQIAQIDPLRVEIIVPVTHFGALQKNQRESVSPEAPLSGDFPATLSIIDPVIDAASGTFRVRLNLPNPGRKLTSGLKCRAHFLDEIAPEETPAKKPDQAPAAAIPGKVTQVPKQPPLASSSVEETSEPETPPDPLPTGTAIAATEAPMACRSIDPITQASKLLVSLGHPTKQWLEVQLSDATNSDKDIHSAIDGIHPGLKISKVDCSDHPVDNFKTAHK